METNPRLPLVLALIVALTTATSFDFPSGGAKSSDNTKYDGIGMKPTTRQKNQPKPDDGSAPRFKRPIIWERFAVANDTMKFACKVRGSPRPFVLFYYEGKPVSLDNDRFQVYKNTLVIQELSLKDSGRYACKAFNTHGELWGNTTIKVIADADEKIVEEDRYTGFGGAPVFTKRRDAVIYLARPANKFVTMDCEGRGYPTPSIIWKKGNRQIFADPEKYVMEGWKLKVLDLNMQDKDNYTCVISNKFGSINWTYTVKILQRLAIAPILDDIANQTVVVGHNVTFTCNIRMSDSQPLLQWLKHYKVNDSYTNEKGVPHVEILHVRHPKYTQSGFQKTVYDPQKLRLYNVTEEDQGWYTCLVVNEVGLNHRSAWLEVLNGDAANVTEEDADEDSDLKQTAIETCTYGEEIIRIEQDRLDEVIKHTDILERIALSLEAIASYKTEKAIHD